MQHEVADWSEDANLVIGPEGREGALVGGVREADRVFEVGARGTRRERHGARVHALLGLQLEERELRGPECEGLRFLDFDGVRGGRELSRRHDRNLETPRGPAQRFDLQYASEAGTRPPYFVTPTESEASRRGRGENWRRVSA